MIEIIVADLNESSANSFAAEMNSRVSAIGLDVNDSEAMAERCKMRTLLLIPLARFTVLGANIASSNQ